MDTFDGEKEEGDIGGLDSMLGLDDISRPVDGPGELVAEFSCVVDIEDLPVSGDPESVASEGRRSCSISNLALSLALSYAEFIAAECFLTMSSMDMMGGFSDSENVLDMGDAGESVRVDGDKGRQFSGV